ncbi:MAG TPA: penicillin acylase family protein [Gemmatimonadales bacterium]|nr:penicillin acylase family protein [Gemmatimonadales bacterium]
MKKLVLGLAIVLGIVGFQSLQSPQSYQSPQSDLARWEQEARDVTIIRDDWGIPHIYGESDADAVFGMMYAQAEDDFNRIETNYLNAMGRLAEAKGESAIYQDLRMKLFINPDSLKTLFAKSHDWLQDLMEAWADGLNFYLYKHPDVKPMVITHFEPWMALSFSEGSIGGDIESVDLRQLQAFYGQGPEPALPAPGSGDGPPAEPSGSNGIAIAPSNTVNHHALLLINPHTSFFFRAELQVASRHGLNVYGASTWGQFFVYQGFNSRVGWMHTSSGADAIDEYQETVLKRGDGYYYKYGREERPLTAVNITVPYKTDRGMAEKKFTVYYSQHGPIVRAVDGKWISVRLMQDPVHALTQSYTRTKARSYREFRKSFELHTNSSNNTVYADADGNIAYFHANFIPLRDTSFDWTKPVDGSNPRTDWHGLLDVAESPNLLNPESGWLYNSNNAPWSAAGPASRRRIEFPRYVDNGTESARGLHAVRVLENRKDFTLDALRQAAYDSYLTSFARMIPALLRAYDKAPAGDPLKTKLAEPIALLRGWDYRWSVASIPTSLAVFWGSEVERRVSNVSFDAEVMVEDRVATQVPDNQLLEALSAAVDRLTADFGTWKTPWGDINRFQRLTDDIVHRFDDAGPSIPVGFPSAAWGSLASFGARPYSNTKKWYGTGGNSFVAVVEFGDSVRARAVTAGGESGRVGSRHFNDQAQRYATGDLRDVYFYRSQLVGHTEREYHPGD